MDQKTIDLQSQFDLALKYLENKLKEKPSMKNFGDRTTALTAMQFEGIKVGVKAKLESISEYYTEKELFEKRRQLREHYMKRLKGGK